MSVNGKQCDVTHVTLGVYPSPSARSRTCPKHGAQAAGRGLEGDNFDHDSHSRPRIFLLWAPGVKSHPRHSSLLLLVCKRWLRVAGPLLYEVVVIISYAQALVLAGAVRANKSYGAYIKPERLRFEGGFGWSPTTFLSAAPNICDLFVTLDIWADDNVSGLCSALPQINPRRLIISHRRPIKIANAKKLRNQLCIGIQNWNCLDTVEYYCDLSGMKNDETNMHRELAEVLTSRTSLTLKNILLDNCSLGFMTAVSKVTTLQSVHVF
ncbi:hypothetical protein BD410DRAFT_759139 [Rickenella mellea]|uniref:F-box domain-containing protein n=1 Tax=Rickenella mellea TaxID=50990 RepID=A0A4V3AZQ1_9AGAM|nr:hypothetical protein BD410DRAFT_759139 [Rickenella mellea]